MNKILLGTLLFSPLLATAATPSFECAKAKGAAETLICKDAGLAALDNELSALYPKAIAGFSPEQQKSAPSSAAGSRGATTAGRRATCASAWKRATSCGSPSCR